MTKKTIIWLRNDLRLSDNAALKQACDNDASILFVYIFDPAMPLGAASKWFLHHALAAFRDDIKKKYKADLVLASGNPQDVLMQLTKKYDINAIYWNRLYEPAAMARDTNIKDYFKKQHLEVQSFNSSLLFEPHTIKNQSGGYFKVFTPFWKKCLTQISYLAEPLPLPKSLQAIAIAKDDLENLDSFNLLPTNPNWAKNWHDYYNISEEHAHELCEEFLNHRLMNYDEGRDFPASNNTSCLSPYLHFGLISPKQIYFKSLIYAFENSAANFLSEVGWREFSYYLLYHFPDLASKNFKAKFDAFPWENNPEYLAKWQKGQTGFPLIDAGMRQLWKTGWMHNRVRMVVASFLTKNLLIDWRIGADWFLDCLVDADIAANSASWQWVAGSGADAAPYFRIFNPITQSEKFDGYGHYIRKWLPELADLNHKEIHCPKNRDHYPKPMIDLKLSRQKALQLYKALP